MSGSLQFEDENDRNNYGGFRSRTILGLPSTPRFIVFLVTNRIAKDEKQAGYILFGITAFCLFLSICIFYFFVLDSNPANDALTKEQAKKSIKERILDVKTRQFSVPKH